MGKIIVLDENTSNKIAAGEVVERPASIVKELVENSIDSGATSISIDIKSGGIKYIKITDNGCGIASDDAIIAFERHATSKITHADDLFSIVTLGFRGEALASIAAVSNIELTTRTSDSEVGTFVKISGGKLIEHSQIGCPVGTTIVVCDLFFNTPARFKFLKKDSTEATYIVDILSRVALARTDISFKLTGAFANRNEVFHTPGNNDLKSAVYNVFGREYSLNSREVDFESEGIRVTGIAGTPEMARANRNSQIVFLNHRYIRSKIVSSAADQAYTTFLMKNKFPFFVINIEMSPTSFDVNVHPSKLDVRFANEGSIFSAVYHALNNAIQSRQQVLEPLAETKKEPLSYNRPVSTFVPKEVESESPVESEIFVKTPTELPVIVEQIKMEDSIRVVEPSEDYVFPARNELLDSLYIGQIFNTYLLFQNSECLFLIDQHAAHEPIKFEEILEKHRNSQTITQELLIPKILNVSHQDIAVYNEFSERFVDLGFDIEPFGGNSLSIRTIPCEMNVNAVEDVFFELIKRFANANKKSELPDDELIYIIACKAAIKGNMAVSSHDAGNLLRNLLEMKNPLSCPHGRPTVLKVERRDFEKMFKRIL